MICPNCGNVNDGRFCSLCGNSLEVQKKKSTNLKITITAGVVLFVVIAAVQTFVICSLTYKEDNKPPQDSVIVTER